MTNQCPSCAYSIQRGFFENSRLLICQHDKMDLIACHEVTWKCKHFEYEAGTDGDVKDE